MWHKQHTRRAAETDHEEAWRGSVFLWRERGLFLGSAGDTTVHTPHAIKIAIAIHGEVYLRAEGSRSWQTFKAAAIAPDYPHQLDGSAAQIALFYLIPETTEAQCVLESYGDGRSIFAVPHRVIEALTPRLRHYLDNGCNADEARALCDDLVEELTETTALYRKRDLRIVRALEYLRAAPDHRVNLPEIASTVALSPDRFAHLFRQEAGLPLRRYLLWLRLRAGIEQMASGDSSITTAAHATGFADAAHFSRTFRRMMGLTPSSLMRNSRFIKSEN